MQPPEAQTADFACCERPLILIGASVRAAAQSAARAGFRVTGIDLFGDVDTRAACEYYVPLDDSTLAVLRQLHPPSEAAVMVVGGLDQHAEAIEPLLRDYPGREGNRELRERLCSPRLLATIARQAGLSFPATSLHERADGAVAGWLIKRPRSSGGLAIHWATPREPRHPSNENIYRQRWVPGRPYGAVFISNGSTCEWVGLCAGRFTRINSSPFVYAGSSGPIRPSTRTAESIAALGQTILQQTGITGLFNADLIINEPNIWLLEVNPRWSASCELIERWLIDSNQLGPRESLLGMAYRAAVANASIAPWKVPDPAAGFQYVKRIVYARQDGQFDARRLPTPPPLNVHYADIPTHGQQLRRHDPVLTVIFKWPAHAPIAWQQTRRLLAQVQQTVVQQTVE